MNRFNLQLSAGHVFGMLADHDGHDHAEQAEAIAQISRHAEHDLRADFIRREFDSFGAFEFGGDL